MNIDDHKFALLLQRQFEEENRPRISPHDEQMAKLLQEQFNQEQNIEKPKDNLVYKINKNTDNTRSLVDPSWELVDPTPNVHNLFMVFNERFFWNKLLTVCVSWSKRMTSCAGICSYQGRGGMCSITLSEPLLKLRPRKDLVETLLHEMIHAFLFVTHNNKDRDGHGPEFHKHMYRINNDAGTNITVYHDFHDEVKLYQQHWWRCDGPCQKWKPFFGMVRRATNRAPGPNDRWWGEHSRNCGGSYIKVKEPEKPTKTKKTGKENKKQPDNTTNDIRNFLPPLKSSKPTNSQPAGTTSKTPTTPYNTTNFLPPLNSSKPTNSQPAGATSKTPTTPYNTTNFKKPGSNIHGFGTSTPSKLQTKSPQFNNNANIKNIHGFHDVDKLRNKSTSTITKPNQKTETSPIKPIPTFTGTGNILSVNTVSTSNYSPVRNHWLSKFKTDKKRISDESPQKINTKRVKTDCNEIMHNNIILLNCPVCNKQVKDAELNEHLDICLQSDNSSTSSDKQPQITESVILDSDDEDEIILAECDICNQMYNTKTIANHMRRCLQNVSQQLADDSLHHKECGVCNTKVNEKLYDKHVEACLLQMYDDMEKRIRPVETTKCLVCKREIPKDNLNAHLEECMNDTVLNDYDMDAFCKDNSLMEEYERSLKEGDSYEFD